MPFAGASQDLSPTLTQFQAVSQSVCVILTVAKGMYARIRNVLRSRILATRLPVDQVLTALSQELAMLSAGVSLALFPTLTLFQAASLSVLLTQTVNKAMCARARNVLRSRILATHLHADQVPSVQ